MRDGFSSEVSIKGRFVPSGSDLPMKFLFGCVFRRRLPFSGLCRAAFRGGVAMGLVLLVVGARVAPGAPPVNDGFTSAKLITGGVGTLAGSNVEATKEAGEPDHAGNAGGKSLWYIWHCSSGGTFDLSISDATFPYLLAIYNGSAFDTLTPIASAQSSSVNISLVPGMVYRIAVDGLDGAGGTFTLRWRQTFHPGGGPDLVTPARLVNIKIVDQNFPSNDCEVEERCTVAGKRRLLRFDMHTQNLGNEDLVFGSPANSPMFQYAPCHNHYHFEALATYRVLTISNDLVRLGNKFGFCLEDVLNVAAGPNASRRYTCDDQGIQVGYSDIYNADLPCQYVDVTGLPAGDYQLEIELDPLHQIPESNEDNNLIRVPFTLTDPCAGRPANDDFLDAQVLGGDIVTVTGDNTCATKQVGEPKEFGYLVSKSIWFNWTPSASGPAVVSTEGSAFDTLLYIYKGTSLGDLAANRVGFNDDIPGDPINPTRQSRIAFDAVAGTTYHISVDGLNTGAGAQGGLVVLNVNPAANDFFDSCQAISGTDGSATGNLLNATAEPSEPSHAGQPGGRSVWYCWTAPASGAFAFDTVGSVVDTLLAVYTGDDVASLTPVAADDDSGGAGASRLTFAAVAGTLYHIALDQKLGSNAPASTGLVQLNWHGAADTTPPRILVQPHSIATFVTSNATLSVSAVGAVPLSYQWYHGGQLVADADNVSGSGTPNLQIAQIKESDRGVYQVRVSNNFGFVDSVLINLVAASRSRVVYVQPMPVSPGTVVPVTLSIAAKGGEHAVECSLLYDPTKLSSPVVVPAPGLPAGSQVVSDLSEAATGRVGIKVTLPPGATLPGGDIALAVCELQLSPQVVWEERVPVCFDDQPVMRVVSAVDGSTLTTVYACGVLISRRPDVLTVGVLADRTVQLQLTGNPGATYEFQWSTDLKTWSTLSTQVTQTGSLTVIDGADHGAAGCFYRTLRKE
jgi:hypothetical protein